MLRQPLYIASYHQSRFGRLREMSVPQIVANAVTGEGARYWTECRASAEGGCAVKTSGGLIAKGPPIGGTGVAMSGWAAKPWLGQAPPAVQRLDAEVAATFNTGGPIGASACTVLKRAA